MTNLFKILIIASAMYSFSAVYYSVERDFKMIFPYDYTIERDTAHVEIGSIPVTKAFCRTITNDTLQDSNGSLYFMSVMEYPEFTFPPDSTDLMDFIIDQSIEQQLAAMNGILDYESDLDQESYYGKIIRISEVDDPILITKAKYIIYKDYFIVLQVKTNRNDRHFRKAEEFLNSFKVINP